MEQPVVSAGIRVGARHYSSTFALRQEKKRMVVNPETMDLNPKLRIVAASHMGRNPLAI
jgi:hypothetical protein